ncbi:glycosyltransferase family 4 protein [Patescibacteria group bacterium]|nr:MAG: glycosyltransferase family 4 protein [Patescibacteria group bacterium]
MRIAIFTDTFLPQVNGVVRSIVTTANVLAKHGHSIAIFTVNAEKLSKKIKAKELDERIQVYPFSSFALPTYKELQVRIPTFVPSLYEVYRFNPDLIHSHTTFGIGWEAVMSANFLKIPLVGTHHGFLAEFLKHVKLDYRIMKPLARRYLSFYYNRCDAVISPSKALVKELLQYKLRRPVHVLSNPVDLKYFSTNKSKEYLRKKFHLNKPAIIHFGRLSYEKSTDLVLRAFAQILNWGIDAQLIVIGDGPERGKLEALGRKLNIDKSVEFTGTLRDNDLTERIAAGDFFVSASTIETQGLVFLEAMALGLPVIGVNAGGVPEYVDNGKNGFIVESGNVRAIAEAMKKFIDHPELRGSFGQNAKECMKKYDAETIVGEIEKIYSALVKS